MNFARYCANLDIPRYPIYSDASVIVMDRIEIQEKRKNMFVGAMYQTFVVYFTREKL